MRQVTGRRSLSAVMRRGFAAARPKGSLHSGEYLNERLKLGGRQASHTGFLDRDQWWAELIDSRDTCRSELDKHASAVGRMRFASDERSALERIQDASDGLRGHVQLLLELPGASRPSELCQCVEDIEPNRRRVVHGEGGLELIEQPRGRSEDAEHSVGGGWAAWLGWSVDLSRHPSVYPL
jgi:hypothetical protein